MSSTTIDNTLAPIMVNNVTKNLNNIPNKEEAANSNDTNLNRQLGRQFIDDLAVTTHEPTPLLKYDGSKLFGEAECLNWTQAAAIQVGGLPIEHKFKTLESHACKLSHGLECLNTTDSKGNFIDVCLCQLSFGKRPSIQENEKGEKRCYIPAGSIKIFSEPIRMVRLLWCGHYGAVTMVCAIRCRDSMVLVFYGERQCGAIVRRIFLSFGSFGGSYKGRFLN